MKEVLRQFLFFRICNDLVKILLNHDTLTKKAESLKAKAYSFSDLNQIVLSLYFPVRVRNFKRIEYYRTKIEYNYER